MIIFLKKKNYHVIDFVMVAIAFILVIPNATVNMFRLFLLPQEVFEELKFMFVANFLGSLNVIIYLLIIALYVFEARRISQSKDISETLNPSKSKSLYEVQKSYKDEKITFYQYQEQKASILTSEEEL